MDRNGNGLVFYRTLNYGYVQLPPGGSVPSNSAAVGGTTPHLNAAAATLTSNHSNGLLSGIPAAAARPGPGSFMHKWMVPHLTPSQINFLVRV